MAEPENSEDGKSIWPKIISIAILLIGTFLSYALSIGKLTVDKYYWLPILVVLALTLVLWWFFYKFFKNRDIADSIWLFVLATGLLAAFSYHIHEFVTEFKALSANNPTIDPFKEYFQSVLIKGTPTIFAVIFLTLIVDFLVYFYNRMTHFRNATGKNVEILKEAFHNLEVFQKETKEAADTLGESTGQIKKASSYILTQSTVLSNSLEFQKEVDQKSFENDNAILKTCYKENLQNHFVNVVSILRKYIKKDSNSNSDDLYAERKLATLFINQYLDQFSGTSEKELGNHQFSNQIQANYEIMSGIVDKLYGAKEEIYKAYNPKNSEGVKIVFFTTLTLPFNKYLNARNLVGPIESAARQWDMVRAKTRNAFYSNCLRYNKNEENSQANAHMPGYNYYKLFPSFGHMWDIKNNPDKYEFRRCCLWMDDKTLGDLVVEQSSSQLSNMDGVLSYEKWVDGVRPADSEIFAFKVYGNAALLKKFAKNEQNAILEACAKLTRIDKLLFDDFMDGCSADKCRQCKSECKVAVGASNRYSDSPLFKLFKENYHSEPNGHNLLGHTLTFENVKNTIFSGSTVEDAFTDSYWKQLCNAIKIGKDTVDIDGQKLQWYEIFFNRHIPIDIFAIGTKSPGDNKVAWHCCLGGYVGGDLNNMTLSWIDSKIVAHAQWDIVEKTINMLYNSDNIEDALNIQGLPRRLKKIIPDKYHLISSEVLRGTYLRKIKEEEIDKKARFNDAKLAKLFSSGIQL